MRYWGSRHDALAALAARAEGARLNGGWERGVFCGAGRLMTVDKSGPRVRRMFGEIAGRYDFLNHLLSLNVDRYWRWRTVRLVPPRAGGKVLDVSAPWRDIRKAAGLPATIGLHGLRHSLASHMAMSGSEAAEIMTALGHRDITTSQKYVHWARDRRQELAERAAATITAAISGVSAGSAAPAGNVVELPKRA